MKPIAIHRMIVRKGAIDLDVVVALDALHVTQEQADRVLDLLPNLSNHVCVNGAGNGSFGEEIVGTELPHLLEHVIIELQGRADNQLHHYTGHTSWLEELDATAPKGYAVMRTTVTYLNDFVALQAAREARYLLEWMVDPAFHLEPNINEMVTHLTTL